MNTEARAKAIYDAVIAADVAAAEALDVPWQAVSWADATSDTRSFVLRCVATLAPMIERGERPHASAVHAIWLQTMMNAGWSGGDVVWDGAPGGAESQLIESSDYDVARKVSPSLVPWAELPQITRRRNEVFLNALLDQNVSDG